MRPRMFLPFRLLMVLASLLIMACCTGPQAKIRKVDLPKEKDLRANWKNYQTYCLGSYAMLFQLKGDKTIQRVDDWREVTSDDDGFRLCEFINQIFSCDASARRK